MALARFFVDAELSVGQRCRLPAATTHHARHVLRLRDGDTVLLFNGRGGEFRSQLAGGATEADLLAFDPVERESPLASTLVQAWIATDKLEWVVEKAVELGTARILLAPARRSVVRLEGGRLDRRVSQLRETAVAACCQCGRNRVPPVDAFTTWAGALTAALRDGARGILLDPEATDSLVQVAENSQHVALAVGPEGGFDEEELTLAERTGYRAARLGPRVLRTETAGLAALAVLQGRGGDFANP